VRLLVSVRNASEAASAVAGGADIVDAKEPTAGALGAVALPVLRDICAEVGSARPVSAALGDVADVELVEVDARAFKNAGAAFVKVGFCRDASADRIRELLAAARRGGNLVIAVAYADVDAVLSPDALIDVAAGVGVHGVLMDTADKGGPGLPRLLDAAAVSAWVARARVRGLIAAVAGRLTSADLGFARDSGADIVGVRGAACDGGRLGRLSSVRVQELQARLRDVAGDRRLDTADLI
jgi:dihydroneopterin aldolase